MSRLSTKARRSTTRRRKNERILQLNAKSRLPFVGDFFDPWGRPCGLGAWALYFERPDSLRILAKTTLPNGYEVSTVWLGTDYGWGPNHRPLIFESMVFGPASSDCRRYSTRKEAFAGHRELVDEWSKRPKLEVVR